MLSAVPTGATELLTRGVQSFPGDFGIIPKTGWQREGERTLTFTTTSDVGEVEALLP